MRCMKKAAGIVFRRLIFAERENRTPDPTLFRRMLYQLSYLGSATDLDSTRATRPLFRARLKEKRPAVREAF